MSTWAEWRLPSGPRPRIIRAVVEVPGYRIRHLLDWGAQGDVFLADDANGQTVALKVVRYDRIGVDPRGPERLRREARLLGAIRSPNIVRVLDLVETDELCCLAMEFLDGERLDAAIHRRAGPGAAAPLVASPDADTVRIGPAGRVQRLARPDVQLPPAFGTAAHVAFALDVLVQLAAGVAELHAINLIHRDIKPENVMLVGGRVVLIDFGLARTAGVTTLTQSNMLVGSLAYMSPEQFRGERAVQGSDVYSLGATLHTLLTGAPPHAGSGDSLAAIAKATRTPSVRRINPAAPAALATVLARALEPDLRDRYPDAAALLADLQACQRGAAVALPFSPGRTWRHHRRQFLVGTLAAGVSLGGFWLLDRGGPEAVADRLAGQLVADTDAAKATFSALPVDERVAVARAFSVRHGTDVALAHLAARTLGLGLLHVGARAGHRGILVGCSVDGAPAAAPALRDFGTLASPRCFLVLPGRAWFLLAADNPVAWWGPDDPRVLHLLVEVGVPLQPSPARSLEGLPTEVGSCRRLTWVEFPAGSYPMRTRSGSASVTVRVPFAVATAELTVAEWRTARLCQANDVRTAQRQATRPWCAHPAEPRVVAAAFAAGLEAEPAGGPREVATMSYW